jgi:hypothetical protein
VSILDREGNKMAEFIPVLDKLSSHYYGEEFRRLSAAWHRDTDHLSSMEKAEQHPAYQEIIALGQGVVPFLLKDLAENHTHWFTALEAITGAQPTSAAIAGNIPKMAEAWVHWAKENGYQW